ncbi:MAG: molybdenum cofactor biosynthesis protein MoaE [Phycisphaeraceae bacterium]|nr:MAG: molybdenum cofactor biosynthesis protein MoaE [Phycisphaeraceae bacterium]
MATMDAISVSITDGPLGEPPARPDKGACGAWVVFEGVVRGDEGGGPIVALRYTAYEPMAQNQLAELGESVRAEFGVDCLMVEHSRGLVPVGACSFRLSIASGHRKEALAAMDAFIDRMKKDVPIWKEPVRG